MFRGVGCTVVTVIVVDSPGPIGLRAKVALAPGGRFVALRRTGDVKLGPCTDSTLTV
jgi:hypothetical protein